MGLAASQARLLTITTRKADCEYQSMRLSHQKIALSRDMTTLSNEYQNSLTKTKLVYDFYGTGDTSTPLSYSLMMTPSILNNNVPIMLTNAEGRVVLDDKYAAAARAAGIPQEGLNGYPSSAIRNAFLQALGEEGIISPNVAEDLQDITYDPTTGVGTSPSTSIITETGTIDALKDRIAELTSSCEIPLLTNSETAAEGDDHHDGGPFAFQAGYGSVLTKVVDGGAATSSEGPITLADLMGDDQYLWVAASENRCADQACEAMAEKIANEILPWIHDQLSSILDIGDPEQAAALDYAFVETMNLYQDVIEGQNKIKVGGAERHWKENIATTINGSKNGQIFGYAYSSRHHDSWWYKLWGQDDSSAAVNLNNIVDAYLTFFADSLGDLESGYNISSGPNSRGSSNVVTDDSEYLYTFKVGSKYSAANLETSQFFDALFNQLCERGWIESGVDKNGESLVHDPAYIQEMMANGMMYMTTLDDDGYYYQGNYSTNSYVKEVADEDAIALAEAKYQTEKQKLNSKEETIDMKMKNLDTEISALTTEYDTVKSVISKNIEKSFKRYQA